MEILRINLNVQYPDKRYEIVYCYSLFDYKLNVTVKKVLQSKKFLIAQNFFFLFTGTISTKYLQIVIMQHASFLYRQRTLRGLRSTIKTTFTTASGKCTIFSSKVSCDTDLSPKPQQLSNSTLKLSQVPNKQYLFIGYSEHHNPAPYTSQSRPKVV